MSASSAEIGRAHMSFRSARVVVTDTALEEFSGILLISEEGWGENQRARYRQLIESTINRIAAMPLIGRVRDDVYPDVRSVPVESHIIFYSYIDDVVYIRHVWHRRRDPLSIDWQSLSDESDE